MNFLQYLESIITVSDTLKNELISVSGRKITSKGDIILNAGERCSDLFFVEKGLVRVYYFIEEKEVTNWFAQEGEFATCFYSFIVQGSSVETIQALENTELIQIPYSYLQGLYKQFPETERIGRILTETYYIKLEERLLNIQFKSAKERYQNLADLKPALLKRAPLGQIASYLGITQETLSRIRAES